MSYTWFLRELRAQGAINNTEIERRLGFFFFFLIYDGFLYMRTELESAQIWLLLQARQLATLKTQKADSSNSLK